MRPNPLLAMTMTVTVAMATTVAGCGGAAAEDAGLSEADVTATTKACTSTGQCPTTFGELAPMRSADLRQLFDAGTVGDTVFSGIYSGMPLCFPQEVPPPDAFPSGARASFGFDPLIHAIRFLSKDHMNGLAAFLWHGKRFTPRVQGTLSHLIEQQPGAAMIPIADVKNNLGRRDVDFSAEAVLTLNRRARSIDLDYHVAQTGVELPGNIAIPGVSSISTEIIRHIWDRVRLINAKEKLYVGEAYVVNTPGEYDARAVPLCYFALTPEGSPAARGGP